MLLLRHRKTANAFGRATGRFFILSFFCSSGQPSIGAPLIFIIPCISVNGKFIGQKNRQCLLFHFIKWGDFIVDYIMQLTFFLIAGAILLFFASLIIRLFFLLLCDLTGFITVMLKGFIKVSNFFIRK